MSTKEGGESCTYLMQGNALEAELRIKASSHNNVCTCQWSLRRHGAIFLLLKLSLLIKLYMHQELKARLL